MGIDEAIEILNYAQKVLTGNTTNPKLNFEETAKAIETLINEYNNLKQIEEAHRIENGELREELKQELEKRRKLTQCHLRYEEMTGIDLLLEEQLWK